MRRKGMSYGEIQERLSVPKSTLSAWLRHIPLSEKDRARLYTARIKNMVRGANSNQVRRMSEIEKIIKAASEEISRPLSADSRRLLGAALYWGEGSKGGAITITNSDPVLIAFMVSWLTESFCVRPNTLRAWLNIYPQQDENTLKRFWSSMTGIPVSRFGKSFVKPISKGVKKNNLYYGTIKVRVPKSTDNKHRIFGWLRGALQEYHLKSAEVQKKWVQLRGIEKPANLD